MKRSSRKSSFCDSAVRRLFPEVEHESIGALTAIWDEVVDRIINEMLTLSEANSVELHINVREEMVMELASLLAWLAEQVVEKRVAGRELSSIDPDEEQKECLGSEGAAIISATARIVNDNCWSKRFLITYQAHLARSTAWIAPWGACNGRRIGPNGLHDAMSVDRIRFPCRCGAWNMRFVRNQETLRGTMETEVGQGERTRGEPQAGEAPG